LGPSSPDALRRLAPAGNPAIAARGAKLAAGAALD
jgi:hypothetical protein